jgi:hypothetical protein
MRHHDRLQSVREGTDYKAPLRAINETVEGIVHCGLIVRQHENGAMLTPEVRALDAIGTQVMRELKNRAEMIRALVDRCNVLEARCAARRYLILTGNLRRVNVWKPPSCRNSVRAATGTTATCVISGEAATA